MRKRLIFGAMSPLAGFALLAASAQAHVSFHPNVLPAGRQRHARPSGSQRDGQRQHEQAGRSGPTGVHRHRDRADPRLERAGADAQAGHAGTDGLGTGEEEVSQITWTGTGSGKIPPGGFQNFPISTQIPDQSGHVLTFKVLQYYDNGKVVRWIGPESSDTPAPTIDVTAANGVIQDVAGSEAGPPAIDQLPSSSSGSSSSSDSASKGLGVVALVIGALGLLAGGAALIRTRRSSS